MANTLSSRLVTIVLYLGLAGCAAVARGPLFDASALPPLTGDTVRIVVFRQSAPGGFGAGVTIPVKLDGQDFVEFPQLGYAWRDLPAGRHELTAARPALVAPGRARLALDMRPGATAYVEVRHSGSAVASVFVPIASVTATDQEKGGAYDLELVDPARAMVVLSRCRRAE
jgi:hypothetical protein